MPFHPTRRRVLGALAAAGFAFDDAFAQPLAPTPACHDGDEPTVRQTEGPYFKPSSPLRADLVEPNSTASRAQRAGSDPFLPADRAGALRPLACRRARRVRQRRLSLSRASVHRWRGPLPLAHHLAGALYRPHPPLPRQGAGAATA